jgi:hypothetical protein
MSLLGPFVVYSQPFNYLKNKGVMDSSSFLGTSMLGGRQLGTLLYLGKICNKVQQAISAPVAHG